MRKYNYFILLFIVAVISTGQRTAVATSVDESLGYPRIENFAQGSVKVDFPSIESWVDFRFLEAWVPIEVSLHGDRKVHVGSVRVQAVTDIDFDERTARLSGPERRKRGYELQNRPTRPAQQPAERLLPAHKRTLSRSELDRQELARIEGMDNYSKYRLQKEFAEQ